MPSSSSGGPHRDHRSTLRLAIAVDRISLLWGEGGDGFVGRQDRAQRLPGRDRAGQREVRGGPPPAAGDGRRRARLRDAGGGHARRAHGGRGRPRPVRPIPATPRRRGCGKRPLRHDDGARWPRRRDGVGVAAHHHAHHPARIRGHPHHERRVDRPDLPIEGPIQYDAAIDPEVARVKLRMGNPWCWSPAYLPSSGSSTATSACGSGHPHDATPRRRPTPASPGCAPAHRRPPRARPTTAARWGSIQ